MPVVARFEQGSGGGGRECPSLLETSRAVVVVGMNARRRLFRAVVVARRGVAVVGVNSFVVRFEQGSGGGQNIPSVSHFERGRGTCVAAVGCVVATLDVPSLTFRVRRGWLVGGKYTPLALAFRAREGHVASGRIDVRCDEEGFTPLHHIKNGV
jgi:hypothetical protein